MALQIILTIASGIITHIPEILGAITVLIANILVALGESLPDIGLQVIEFIVGLGESFGTQAYEVFGTAFLDLLDGIGEWLSSIGETISGWIDNVVTFFENLGTDLGTSATNMWENVKTTVSNALDFLKGLFNFEWKLPDIKLPHFSVEGSFNLDPANFSLPKIGVEWYAKAMSTPYLLENASIFGAAGGKLLGGGETGQEIIYGREQLMSDIAAVVDAKLSNIQLVAPIYIGGKKIDQQIVTANARNSVISGGR